MEHSSFHKQLYLVGTLSTRSPVKHAKIYVETVSILGVLKSVGKYYTGQ